MPPRGTLLLQNPVRLPALALLLATTFGVRVATAQTVIVRSAPVGSTIELALDSGRVTSAIADKYGDATLATPAQATDFEAQIYVDACGSTVRVLLVRLRPGPPQAGCNRTEIGSVFLVRPVTTFVVDIDGTSATAHVTQGKPPREWLERGEGATKPKRDWGEAQTGFTLSGGAGFSTFSRAVNIACGDVSACESNNFGFAFSVGADYWFKRFLGVAATYLQPADVTVNGTATGFRFNSEMQTRMVTVNGKVGGVAGPARLYGIAGINFHNVTTSTSQTSDPSTVTVGGVPQTIPGGTQTYAQEFRGWDWVFGGGFEVWAFKRAAIFGEVNVPKFKTAPTGGGEGGLDDRAFLVIVGARIRIGG